MTRTRWGCVVGLVLVVGCGGKVDDALRSAGDEAQGIAESKYDAFKFDAEHLISAGAEEPVKVLLEQERCYRFIAVTADPAPPDEVSLSFKHSEQVIEEGSDFIDLSMDDGDLRKKRVIWGVCVWPSLEGELSLFSNLDSMGGAIVVLSAPVGKLTWKDGKDVRVYLKATGDIDVEALEREDVTPGLTAILEAEQSKLPEGAPDVQPAMQQIQNTTHGTWQHEFSIEDKTCYHLMLTSPNCILKYKIIGGKNDKVITDDGAPDEVGRTGWSHDFCATKKTKGQMATMTVKMQMLSDEFDHCWFAASVWAWEAKPKKAVKINKAKTAARKKVSVLVKKCKAKRKKCEKGCIVKQGKKKVTDFNCKHQCLSDFGKCTGEISFEGEIQ